MMYNKLRFSLLAVGLLSLSTFSQLGFAVPVTYFGRDDNTGFMSTYPNSLAKFNQFTSALVSYGVADIESATGENPTINFGLSGISATATGVKAQNNPGFQIGGRSLLEKDTDPPFTPVNTKFTFNQYINAFGSYVMQGGDDGLPEYPGYPFNNDNPTTFRLRDTVANTFVDVPAVQIGPHWGFDNALFFGVFNTAAPFNEVEILEAIDVNDGMLYDNLVAGRVPEPGSLMLVILGATCFLGRGKRFRRN